MTRTVPKFAAVGVLMAAVIATHLFLCLIYLETFGDLWNQEGCKGSATLAPEASLMRATDTRVHVRALVNTQKRCGGGGVFSLPLLLTRSLSEAAAPHHKFCEMEIDVMHGK